MEELISFRPSHPSLRNGGRRDTYCEEENSKAGEDEVPGSFMLVTLPHRVEEKLHGTIISLPTLNPERDPIALG